MRLFVAMDVSAEIRAALAEGLHRLAATKADVRWVPPENLHVTVKFLGEVPEPRLGELLPRLVRAAGEVPAFPLELQGLARLPGKGPVRVIAAHVVSPDQRIVKLHRLVDSAAGGMGLPLDTRVYVPHLTLGRVSSNHGLNRLLRMLEKHAADFLGAWRVENVTLYESLPGEGPGTGPHYEVRGRFALGPGAARGPQHP